MPSTPRLHTKRISPIRALYPWVPLLIGLAVFLWLMFFKGQVVFLQGVGANDISAGYRFGPIYLKKDVWYRSDLTLIVPKAQGWWEITTQLLNSQRKQVNSETKLLAPSIMKLPTGSVHTETRTFRQSINEDDFYYLYVQQTQGSAPDQQSNGPITILRVKENVGTPTSAWICLILGTLLSAFLVYFRIK